MEGKEALMASPGWNLKMVRAREALNRLRDDDGNVDWGNVSIAHIDTGVREHEVFREGPGGAIAAFLDIGAGHNYLEPDEPPIDPLTAPFLFGNPGHGTRTGGLLAGLSEDYSGVAPGVRVMPYRVSESVIISGHRGVHENIAAAIDDAIANQGCQAVNICLGRPSPVGEAIGKVVDDAYDKGIPVICAAGQAFDRVIYPAKHLRTIACGAVNPRGAIWFDYHPENGFRERVDVWAPGDEVRVPTVKQVTGDPGQSYKADGEGTSFATPHVAAAYAMWLRRWADRFEDGAQAWRRIEAFRKHLVQKHKRLTGNDHPFRDDDDVPTESGILDIAAILESPPPAVTNADYRSDIAADDKW